MNNLTLSAGVRTKVYLILGLLFLVTGSIDTGVAVVVAAGLQVPLWLTLSVAVATKVGLYLAGAVGYTAATHTSPSDDKAAEPEPASEDVYQQEDYSVARARYAYTDEPELPYHY